MGELRLTYTVGLTALAMVLITGLSCEMGKDRTRRFEACVNKHHKPEVCHVAAE